MWAPGMTTLVTDSLTLSLGRALVCGGATKAAKRNHGMDWAKPRVLSVAHRNEHVTPQNDDRGRESLCHRVQYAVSTTV